MWNFFECSTTLTRVRYRVKHERRNSISTSNYVLFSITWIQQPFTEGKVDLINEWKIKKDLQFLKESYYVLWRQGSGWKMRWLVAKTNNGRNFLIYKILSCWLFPYRQKKSFGAPGQNRPGASLPVLDCRSQPRELSVLVFVFCFFPLLGNYERHCLFAIQIFQCFCSHNLIEPYWFSLKYFSHCIYYLARNFRQRIRPIPCATSSLLLHTSKVRHKLWLLKRKNAMIGRAK